jgi:RimJ/RimL family protein N-acetyltransferase
MMPANPVRFGAWNWPRDLPPLVGTMVTLREPVASDAKALMDLLSIVDACRFGLDEPVSEPAVQDFIESVRRDREGAMAFAYAVIAGEAATPVGLIHVRGLDPGFETAAWECTLAPSVRGSGAFLEAARLVGTFVFESVGAYRLEARVVLQNGRANGALRKLGAVQEGILRRSARHRGEYVDQVLWSVLKDDWGDRWAAAAPRIH